MGQLIAFNMIAGRISGPILKLTQLWQDFQQAGISLKRLGDILNTSRESGTERDRGSLPEVGGEVRFEKVTFRYRPDAPPALSDLSLVVRPGQVIGLVGRSGSGKSTLAKLVQRQIAAQKAKSLSDALMQIDDLSRQTRELEQELAKISDLGEKMILVSPVDGTVKGLNISTVGGVVSPAEILMEVAPLDERLEVEAFVGNQDIGYVREGQAAEVKVHTFPFTRYGVISARVELVARDATVDEKLGLIYRTRLSLAENVMLVDGGLTPLLPGMAVTAEIATGKRRLIEFFLAPLLKARQESLRER